VGALCPNSSTRYLFVRVADVGVLIALLLGVTDKTNKQ